MGHITLILGGVKSGKTSFAQREAEREERTSGQRVLYVATAQALDDEMRSRVRRHRASRPQRWETLEEPLAVAEAIETRLGRQPSPGILILDCLTLLMTNLILTTGDPPDREESDRLVCAATERIFDVLEDARIDAYLISNLVETGLIAPTLLGRMFQEIAGSTHQYAAGRSDRVYRLTAGIPERIR